MMTRSTEFAKNKWWLDLFWRTSAKLQVAKKWRKKCNFLKKQKQNTYGQCGQKIKWFMFWSQFLPSFLSFHFEWKKSDLNSVPSEPIWWCNIISLTSFQGFLSVHASKKWRRRKPSRRIPAIWMCNVWQTISLSLLFQSFLSFHFLTPIQFALIWQTSL